MHNSTLNIFDGKICSNECINNSEIFLNKDSINNSPNTYQLFQSFCGVGICADLISKVHLYKGEISNNISRNNAKLNLISPVEGTKTNLNEVNICIQGSGIYGNNCEIEILDGAIIQGNSCQLNTIINIEKNCNVAGSLNCSINGGQVFISSSKVKFIGGIIRNTNNIKKIASNIEPDENGKIKDISNLTLGGGIHMLNCNNIDINNLKIIECSSGHRGAIYISKSTGKYQIQSYQIILHNYMVEHYILLLIIVLYK